MEQLRKDIVIKHLKLIVRTNNLLKLYQMSYSNFTGKICGLIDGVNCNYIHCDECSFGRNHSKDTLKYHKADIIKEYFNREKDANI